MSYDSILSRNKSFEFPNQYVIENMDLIDLRRKILKWCGKSQGAIGPCRDCPEKCSGGIRAIQLYDGAEAPKASGPEVTTANTKKKEKAPTETKKETTKMKKEEKKKGRPVSQWYDDAVASGDPVKWCMDHLNITEQKAKKRVYMYEYNRFGMRRSKTEAKEKKVTKPVVNTVSEPVVKAVAEPVMKTETDDTSLIIAMETEMKTLTAKKQEYRTKIDEMTNEYNKISDRLEAITMCVEQYRSTI